MYVCSPSANAFTFSWHFCAFTYFLYSLCFLISTSVVEYFVERINNPFPQYNETCRTQKGNGYNININNMQQDREETWMLQYWRNVHCACAGSFSSFGLFISRYSMDFQLKWWKSNSETEKKKKLNMLRAFSISSLYDGCGAWVGHALSRSHEWNEMKKKESKMDTNECMNVRWTNERTTMQSVHRHLNFEFCFHFFFV